MSRLKLQTVEHSQLNCRLDDALRERLTRAAQHNKRSLSAEVAARLERSFQQQDTTRIVAENNAMLKALCAHYAIDVVPAPDSPPAENGSSVVESPAGKKQPKLPRQRLPVDHPVRPFRTLLGMVDDKDIARVSGVPVATVAAVRESFGYPPAPRYKEEKTKPIPDYHGPLLGFESLLGVMSAAKISRTTGLPLAVIEHRRDFLGLMPYRRVSRVAKYAHLLGKVPNTVLAKLAGVSTSRISDMRKNETK